MRYLRRKKRRYKWLLSRLAVSLRVGLVVSIRMLLSVLIQTSEPTSAEKP